MRRFIHEIFKIENGVVNTGGKIHIIVGIDPGINTAYAAIGLDGKFVASGTLKEADADRIVAEIAKLGIPSMVASDVSPAPSFVQKVAARFNARTFVPRRPMLQEEKGGIAGETKNLHERDALAAAIKCYREYANRLRQIEMMETPLEKDLLKHMVIQGFPLHAAIAKLEGRGRPAERGGTGNPVQETPKEAGRRRDDELVALAQENVNLRKALEAERMRIGALEAEISKLKGARFAEIGRDAEVRRLREQNERMGWLIRRLKRKRQPG